MPAVKMVPLLKAGVISTHCGSSHTSNGGLEKALTDSIPSCAQVKMFNTCGAGDHNC